MHDINQFTITEAVKQSFKSEEGSREVNLTHEEWIGILMFLFGCGKISNPERHEFILLSDVVGFSALVDMINMRGGSTEGANPGPFYLDDAPCFALGGDLWGRTGWGGAAGAGAGARFAGEPDRGGGDRHLAGRQYGTSPIQEEASGQDKYDLRGIFTTGEDGRYWYTAVLPKPYAVPYDGPVGRLLRAGNRHVSRALHLPCIVRAPGYRPITAELFFDYTEYLDNDAIFGVRRSLITLSALGHVGSQGKRFHLRPKVMTLGSGFAARIDELLLPELWQIIEAHGDAASVAMLDGTDVIHVAHHSTQRARRASVTLGARYPAHATSLGRVLLAGLPDDQLDRACEAMTLAELTSRTVTSKAELRRLVWKARDPGYATTVDQLDYGITALAVPIRNAEGRVVAALNASGHSRMVTPDEMVAKRLADLRAAASRISAAIARVPALNAVFE